LDTILRNIWAGFSTASTLDQINLVLGVAGVVLMVRRTLWAFPVGLAAVTVQGILFFRTRIYADAALQIVFFVALAWGWWHWIHGRGAAKELPVTTLSWRARAVTVAAIIVTTIAWALALQRWTDAIIPWRDAAVAALQIGGQILQVRKKLENWALFTLANVIAIPAYWSADLAFTAFLFGIYLVLGLTGWRAWGKAMAR
jgi:nicotinamide mononucleotide transporter